MTDTNHATPVPTEPIDAEVAKLAQAACHYGHLQARDRYDLMDREGLDALMNALTARLNAAPAPAPDREAVRAAIDSTLEPYVRTNDQGMTYLNSGLWAGPIARDITDAVMALLDRTEGGGAK